MSILAASVLIVATAEARDRTEPLQGAPNGLAQTPPMGWNSWNRFACKVNEKLVRGAADEMVSTGMRDAG